MNVKYVYHYVCRTLIEYGNYLHSSGLYICDKKLGVENSYSQFIEFLRNEIFNDNDTYLKDRYANYKLSEPFITSLSFLHEIIEGDVSK